METPILLEIHNNSPLTCAIKNKLCKFFDTAINRYSSIAEDESNLGS